MEATKRSYLKPEVERFEMKMEAEFMSASKPIIEIEEEDLIIAAGISPCFAQGTTIGTNPQVNQCFQMNKNYQSNGCFSGAQDVVNAFKEAGIKEGMFYKILEIRADGSIKIRESDESCQ